jgi:chemotaxis family two-component system response regulator Rcp1
VVVLTTSKAEEDVARAYDSGANSFVVKPTDFRTLVEVMKAMEGYWNGIVTLPPSRSRGT